MGFGVQGSGFGGLGVGLRGDLKDAVTVEALLQQPRGVDRQLILFCYKIKHLGTNRAQRLGSGIWG